MSGGFLRAAAHCSLQDAGRSALWSGLSSGPQALGDTPKVPPTQQDGAQGGRLRRGAGDTHCRQEASVQTTHTPVQCDTLPLPWVWGRSPEPCSFLPLE